MRCDACHKHFTESEMITDIPTKTGTTKWCKKCYEALEHLIPPLTKNGNRKKVAAGVPEETLRKNEDAFIRAYNAGSGDEALSKMFDVRGHSNIQDFIQTLIDEGKIDPR